jgi:hypothetical protein
MRVYCYASGLQRRNSSRQKLGRGRGKRTTAETMIGLTVSRDTAGWAGETCGCGNRCRPNDPDAKLRGQGPRAEADAARRLPACEARDAGGVTL